MWLRRINASIKKNNAFCFGSAAYHQEFCYPYCRSYSQMIFNSYHSLIPFLVSEHSPGEVPQSEWKRQQDALMRLSGDNVLRGDQRGVNEASFSTIEASIRGTWKIESTYQLDHLATNVVYVVFMLSQMGNPSVVRQIIDLLCIGDETIRIFPFVVGGEVPPLADLGNGVPLVSFRRCRTYTFITMLQLLSEKRISKVPHLKRPSIVVVSDAVKVIDSALVQVLEGGEAFCVSPQCEPGGLYTEVHTIVRFPILFLTGDSSTVKTITNIHVVDIVEALLEVCRSVSADVTSYPPLA
eukprot:Tbor_TRINITY_DN3029_c0_g1::TRINITY_DN3029_c0_g1_i1::g.17315::m.17315